MTATQYKIGECILDTNVMSLTHKDEVVKLSAKVYELLKLFIENDEHIVSRQQAIESIWEGNQGVGEKGFTNSVWLLRKAFKDLAIEDEVLLTLPKLGYQLVLPIQTIQDSKPEQPLIAPKSVNFNPLKTSYGVIIACLALIGYLGYELFLPEKKNKNVLTIVSPTKQKITNFEGVEEHIAVSNNGQQLAMQWRSGDLPGKIYIKDLARADSSLTLISFGEYEEASPAWSKADDKLAYIRVLPNGGCEVRVRNLLQNTDRFVADGCFYLPFKRVLTWSKTDDNAVIFSKQLSDRVALFSYSLEDNSVKQLSFPQKNEIDFAPHPLNEPQKLAFIREKSTSMQMSLLILNTANELSEQDNIVDVITNKVTIVDFDYSTIGDAFYVNHIENSALTITKVTLSGEVVFSVAHSGMPSNVTFSDATNTLYISEHISKEYIGQLSYDGQQNVRKISSSSRDMYARYSTTTDDIIFLSNRSKLWGIWKNNQVTSKSLTKNMGNAGVAAMSPTSGKFVVPVHKEDNQVLYLGDIESELFEVIDLQNLSAENLSWAKDGQSIYFKGFTDQESAIYQYHLTDKSLTKLNLTQANYVVEGATPNTLYFSKFNLNGLWKLDVATNDVSLVTDKLAKYDFGAFYHEDDAVYFVSRTNQSDKVLRINSDNNIDTVMSFPANNIRKFFGISSADKQSMLLTLKVANEADIVGFTFR
ncbi:winged helix-turn-helix domain-containing protein [Shewanella gaetbuli]